MSQSSWLMNLLVLSLSNHDIATFSAIFLTPFMFWLWVLFKYDFKCALSLPVLYDMKI